MKLPFDSVTAMVGRMTPRERRLFGVLVGAVLAAIAVAVYLATAAVFGGIQEDVDHGRQVLVELYRLAPGYQEASETKRQIEDAIRNNRQSVRVAANEMLKKMELADEVPGATGNKMSDIVSFEGKTNDVPVETGKAKKKAAKGKGKEPGGILQIEQNLEFREVPALNLFTFLDQVEQSKDLLFVTRLDVGRKFNNLLHVRAMVTIATYQFEGGEAEPQPATAEE
jgi:hypothetical protein